VELGAPQQPATLPWLEAYESGDRYPSGSLTGDGDHRRLGAGSTFVISAVAGFDLSRPGCRSTRPAPPLALTAGRLCRHVAIRHLQTALAIWRRRLDTLCGQGLVARRTADVIAWSIYRRHKPPP
jgi:hypothetical protein